ncbi:MAG TPA: histidine phosphatase family protein [Candidatus Saccharimonadales bacterium]|jgi:broad specificity phosphatase PhoE
MILFRHGESTRNDGSNRADPDPALTLRGEAESRQLFAYLAGRGIDGMVASSPAQRTVRTFDVGTVDTPLASTSRFISADFEEIDMGVYTGMTKQEIFAIPGVQDEIDELGNDWRPKGGESVTDRAEKMYEGLERFGDSVAALDGHSFGLKALIGVRLGWSRQQILEYSISNAEAVEFDIFEPAEPVRLFKPDVSDEFPDL